MKKLAILVNDIREWSGADRWVVELVKRINFDFDITIYSYITKNELYLADTEIKKLLPTEVKLKYYKVFIMPYSLDRLPITKTGLKMLFELRRYDIIYIIEESLTSMSFILLALKLSKAKIIFGLHDPYITGNRLTGNRLKKNITKLYNKIFKKVLFRMPEIHVLNKDDYNLLQRLGYSGSLNLIPNFLYTKKKEIKNLNKSQFIALFVGRLAIQHKGLDLLEEIIKKVLKENNKIVFHIVGSGEGVKIIKRIIKQYPKNVIYKGFLSENELEREYGNATVFVLTSIRETFSLVTLEAQSHGLPVVSFNISGPNEIITNFSGKLIEPFNTDKFAEEILKYYNMWKENKINLMYKNKIVDYVYSKYSDKTIIPKLERMLSNN
ncbi:MAG: glycosyltransferase [Candidatus Micrarchaeaceae archaeon]